jgi:hypothetical protein
VNFSFKKQIQFGLFFYLLFAISVSAVNFPDYNSYQFMYESWGLEYIVTGKDPFFLVLMHISRTVGLDYEQFRLFVSFLGVGLLWIASRTISRSSMLFFLRTSASVILLPIVAFSVFFFAFEFFSIRIRAGLAISFFLLAFVFWITSEGKVWLKSFSFVLFLMAIGTHLFTSLTLFLILIFPSILYYHSRWTSGILGRKFVSLLNLFMAFFIGYIFMVFAVSQSEIRGEHLASDLNVIRFIFLAVIPILLFVVGIGSRSKYIVMADYFNRRSNEAKIFKESWVSFLTIFYIGLALALSAFVLTGNLGGAGEAIVRLFTLSSVVAFLVLSFNNNSLSFFWLFLMFSNSLFFMNTVFGTG